MSLLLNQENMQHKNINYCTNTIECKSDIKIICEDYIGDGTLRPTKLAHTYNTIYNKKCTCILNITS